MREINSANLSDWAYGTSREWLLTNGTGAFAMGTVAGPNTRRYHGHLAARPDESMNRMVLLAGVDAFFETDHGPIGLSCNQYVGSVYPDGHRRLHVFRYGECIEWVYGVGEGAVLKRLVLHPGENACTVTYENRTSRAGLITLRPLICHKPYHGSFRQDEGYPDQLDFGKEKTVAEHGGLPLTLFHPGAQRIPFAGWYYRFEHVREIERGLEQTDDLYCPCELRYELASGETAVLTASLGGPAAPATPVPESGDRMVSAARHFVVDAMPRQTLIAGYPWFTDWGRDTMISLPGLCLCQDRVELAKSILSGYVPHLRQGLIPNRFPDTGAEPEYNTADATLWFVNAVWETIQKQWDVGFAASMLAAISEIIDWHQVGTMYGIRVDPDDGLLTQGEPGTQLTWMDVKIGSWVVTPRWGKPVEVNGLWVNALRIAEQLAARLGQDSSAYAAAADRAEESFRRKFWSARHGWYFDTVDPFDAQLRPNQLIPMALPFGPAAGEEAVRALEAVRSELLVPEGLRSLGPQELHYCGRYEGPMEERDAAYHQGTVWPWLLGCYVAAQLRLRGDISAGEEALAHSEAMLDECGLNGIAEVYDGDEPRRPGGCPWQAWSVAEVIRARCLLERAKAGSN